MTRTTRTKPRRWIAAEIERLDPATDYEAIWRLTSSYGLNDFALNLVYAHLFPHWPGNLAASRNTPTRTLILSQQAARPAGLAGDVHAGCGEAGKASATHSPSTVIDGRCMVSALLLWNPQASYVEERVIRRPGSMVWRGGASSGWLSASCTARLPIS